MSNLVPAKEFSHTDIELIKKTIAKEATHEELKLFLQICNRTQLDPFARQIFFVRRGGIGQTTLSIDGFRLVAERTGKYEGQVGPLWCGEDGQWKDVWLEGQPPLAAKVGVYRAGFREAVYSVANFSAYNAGSPIWRKMPALMLAKCAESLALRRAFPMELSGLYTQEEMDQATDSAPAPAPIPAPVSAPAENPIIKAFSSVGVTQKELEQAINSPVSDWSEQNIKDLRDCYLKIKAGVDKKQALSSLTQDAVFQ